MTHPTITTSQSCDAAPGLVDVTITIGNDGFTEPVTSIDLYGSIGLGTQPPLAPGGQWPKVLHQVVPAGSYTAGAQFHFATLPTRATEISIDVDATVCTTSSSPPPVASEPPPPASTETGTPISIDAPATDAPTPTASTEPEPKVEPVVPVALPTTTSSTTTASVAVPVTLPRTGAGDRATIGLTPGILCLCVGLALVALSRRTRRTVRS